MLIGRDLTDENPASEQFLEELAPGQVSELRRLAVGDDSLRVPLHRRAMRISRANSQDANRRAPKAEVSKSKLMVVVMAQQKRIARLRSQAAVGSLAVNIRF